MQETWTAVDRYLEGLLAPHDPALLGALSASEAAGLPPIQVSALQGKLLHLLARAVSARRILEVGTLGGYSTLWLARALPPEGRLITLELEEAYAAVARANLERAGLAERVEVRVGRALAMLPALAGPFDLVFLDADKREYAEYFEAALPLTRPGSLIVADNVVRDGEVADAASDDPRVQGARRFHARVAREPRVSATAIQTLGVKGYDGFTLALVLP